MEADRFGCGSRFKFEQAPPRTCWRLPQPNGTVGVWPSPSDYAHQITIEQNTCFYSVFGRLSCFGNLYRVQTQMISTDKAVPVAVGECFRTLSETLARWHRFVFGGFQDEESQQESGRVFVLYRFTEHVLIPRYISASRAVHVIDSVVENIRL